MQIGTRKNKMSNKYHHIAIALAGVCQSAMLVPQLADSGRCSSIYYERAIKSIFVSSPNTTADVYEGAENIKTGLQTLIQLIASEQKDQMELVRYVFGAIGVSNKLIKNEDALNKISQRLVRIQGLHLSDDHTFSDNIDEITYALAGIYSDIISPIASKIRVTGKMEYLQNSLVQAKVRTSLFGAVRSAILWHQMGGNRLQFIFSRKAIVNAAHDILDSLNQQ